MERVTLGLLNTIVHSAMPYSRNPLAKSTPWTSIMEDLIECHLEFNEYIDTYHLPMLQHWDLAIWDNFFSCLHNTDYELSELNHTLYDDDDDELDLYES